MKKIIHGIKYDTDTAVLKAEFKNRYYTEYLEQLEKFFEEHPELKPEEDFPSPPIFDGEDPWFQPDDTIDEPVPPILETDEVDIPDEEWPESEDENRGEEDTPQQEEAEEIVWPILSPLWYIEKLYRKDSTGEWFLMGKGGLFSRYPYPEIKPFDGRDKLFPDKAVQFMKIHHKHDADIEKLHPSTLEAFQWACDHLSVDEVEAIFGEVPE